MKISTKLKGILLLGGISFSNATFAQDEIGQLIAGSPADATALTKAYLEPMFKGFGLGLNSGWTNTGSVKKLLRFEVRVGVTGAMVPASGKSFDVSKLGLTRIQPTNMSNVMAPTVAGADTEGPEMHILDNNGAPIEGTEFNLPAGLNPPQSMVPAPQLQANIGLIKGFEAAVRFVPEVKLGDDYGTLSMMGGGIKFQPLRLVSKKLNSAMPFDLAVALGYSKFKYAYNLDVQAPSGAQDADGNSIPTFKNQKVEATFSGINAEAIISKKLLMLTPFVSLGYQTSNTDAGVRGSFATVKDYDFDENRKIYEVTSNPVSINEKYIKNFRASAGFQLNLFLLHLYGSYNIATYNYVNVGLGIGFGK